MAYATVEAFVAVVGAQEAALLAKATPPATGHDAARIQRELDDASAELDTYFAVRYPTPLDPVPPTANRAAIALAREGLDRNGRDHVKAEAARHRAWARDVAKGLAVLGGGEIGEDVPAANPGGGIQYASPDRVFDDAGLAAFTGRRP